MKNIKSIISNNKALIENFSYLSVFQILNLAFPLFTYPYLIRILGVSIYGKIVFAQAIIGYLIILISFGFNISATKEISIYRSNKLKLSEIISSVFILKIILFCLSLSMFFFAIVFINDVANDKLLFLLTLWMCFAEILSFNFYFQGIEEMKYISIISFLLKLVTLLLIFVFIHEKTDYLLVPLINLIGTLLAGLVSLYILIYKDKIRLYIPSYLC